MDRKPETQNTGIEPDKVNRPLEPTGNYRWRGGRIDREHPIGGQMSDVLVDFGTLPSALGHCSIIRVSQFLRCLASSMALSVSV